MVSLGWVLFLVALISFAVFVAFFGRLPALRNTPIASLHRLLAVRIPNAVLALDQRLTSGKLSRSLLRFGRYLMYDRHPTVVIIFVLILAGAEYLYLPQVWPRIGCFTKVTAAITVALPYIFLYLSCAADPGYITPENHAYYHSLYPYDHTLFHPGRECKTCKLPKPARSKHCSVCKKCVAKSDHHCIFINSCVGYGNHHWFLLLLASTALLTIYGACLGLSLISERVRQRNPAWSLWPSRELGITRWLGILGVGVRRDVNMGASTLLALFTSPLIVGLSLYTLYLVYQGTTTNETLKWSECQEDMEDGYVFRRRLPPVRQRETRQEPRWTRWPVEAEQIVVVTENGQPPGSNSSLPGEGEWVRVRSLRDVENLYDMGFWDNLMDAFVADYTFGRHTTEPASERRTYRHRAAKQLGMAFPP